MKFCGVISFEENGLILNYWFSSILFDETSKFETYINMYILGSSKPNLEENGQIIDFSGIFKC